MRMFLLLIFAYFLAHSTSRLIPNEPTEDQKLEDVAGGPGAYIGAGLHASGIGETAQSQDFADQFSNSIYDMDPEDVVTFELGAGQRKEFFVRATSLPATIIGAYSVSGGERNKITFNIYTPNEIAVLSKSHRKEEVFQWDAEVVGLYKLEFVNKNVIDWRIQSIIVLYNGVNRIWSRRDG